MTSKTLNITLPEEMFEQMEVLCKVKHYNRSELMREALRRFFFEYAVEATAEEKSAIREGREARDKGDFVTLDDLET
ncbi:MAG: ribbon-helix-helix domain-containing protein [Alphaproteobacteria bacterium]